MDEKDGAWFRQKKFGYGAGWPIAWQGWLVLALYIGTAMIAALLWESQDDVYQMAAVILFIGATIALIALSRAKTRGGWRWRP